MGKCEDFISESLRQNEFWLRIMQEHSLFIRQGLPCDQEELRSRAQDLEQLFKNLRKRLSELSLSKEAVSKFNNEVIKALNKIIDFKSDILKLLLKCKLGGFNFPLLIDHLRREAIRFRTILLRLENNIELPLAEKVLQEEIFWLRIMGDHARFIAHLLDPSERNLVKQSFNFAERFETLRLQARDLEMVVPRTFENYLLPEKELADIPMPPGLGEGLPEPFVIPRLNRFNEEVIEATKEIKKFKQTAKQLINTCKVLSVIDPLLADHVLREAEMALEDLKLLNEKKLIKD